MGFSMPFFPVYAAELLADGRFQTWTLEERGAWLTLVAYNWNDGDLPAAPSDLARLLHVGPGDMARIWSAIGDRFCHVPGSTSRVWSPRLEEERDKAEVLSRKRAKAGESGANARWNKDKPKNGKRMRLPLAPHSDADAVALAKPCPPPPPPSSPPPTTSTVTFTPKEETPCASQPVDRGARLAGESEGLVAFRAKLSQALGVEIGTSKRPDVTAYFESQLRAEGPDTLAEDCIEAARRSSSGTPSSLAWFVPWLKRLPATREARQ